MNAVALLAPILFSLACSPARGHLPDDEPLKKQTGSLELNLTAPAEVTMASVRYAVFDAGGDLVLERSVGAVDGEQFQFLLRLPVASGYELELFAEGLYDGETVPCEGRVRFNISRSELTEVALDVVCSARGRALRPAGNGGAQVTANVSVNEGTECAVESLTVGPLVVYQGRAIDVKAVAHPDRAVLQWSVSGKLHGSFELNEALTEGQFLCERGQGEVTVTLVSGECTDTASVPVTCAAPSVCGDGVVEVGEDCDDGNTINEDGCTSRCVVERCGDGVLQRGESCDDGNQLAGDGCGTTCAIEVCGNGLLEGKERCDDGNLTAGDGCSGDCEIESCGDGIVQRALDEECDDGNREPRDGCSVSCRFEDTDADGVIDRLDECPRSNDDLVDLEGCTLEQRCPCDEAWESKTQYLTCSANVLDRLFSAEIIDARKRAEWEVDLAENHCGR